MVPFIKHYYKLNMYFRISDLIKLLNNITTLKFQGGNLEMVVVSEKERGLGVKFDRIRRITGYLTGDLSTWNSAKRAEEHDRVKHA